MLPLKQELEQRWLLKQYTDEKLFELYDKWWEKFYFGMDPTADSLHLGNFVNFMNAIHLMRRGNICIPLVGWATGMIGDPGGKDSERSFLDEVTLANNVSAIHRQIGQLITNIKNVTGENLQVAPIVNNKDFYTGMWFLDFLREVGKYITVNNMMTKETVKKRIEDPDKSISYTEFSYMLIQGYDFVKLYQEQGCKLQIAWSDQRWNVVTGTELIRKKFDGEAYALTCNLVLDSNGKKFGKSEGNAIWLDPAKNKPYFVYQYFLNVTDTDVERFLKLFTLLEFDVIGQIVAKHNEDPAARYGQGQLAYRVVEIIFWTDAALQAQEITKFVFADNKMDLLLETDPMNIKYIYENIGFVNYVDGLTAVDAVSELFAVSRWDAKKLIQSWGIYIWVDKISEQWYIIKPEDFANWVAIISKGKKNIKFVVKG